MDVEKQEALCATEEDMDRALTLEPHSLAIPQKKKCGRYHVTQKSCS